MQIAVWSLIVIGGIAAIYGVHRLFLWMETKGWLYYVNKKPEGSAAGCMTALQEVLEPQTQHVFKMKDVMRSIVVDDSSGANDPPSSPRSLKVSPREE